MDIQRYKVGYYSDEWGMSSNTPCLLKDNNGHAVKYEHHVKEITTLREKLRVAEDELLRVKDICLRECGVGIVNEVVLTKIREMK